MRNLSYTHFTVLPGPARHLTIATEVNMDSDQLVDVDRGDTGTLTRVYRFPNRPGRQDPAIVLEDRGVDNDRSSRCRVRPRPKSTVQRPRPGPRSSPQRQPSPTARTEPHLPNLTDPSAADVYARAPAIRKDTDRRERWIELVDTAGIHL